MDPLGWMPFHLQNNPNRGAVAGLMGGAAAVISDIAGVKGLRRNVATKDEPIETARVGILGATIGAAAELGLQAQRRRRVARRAAAQLRAHSGSSGDAVPSGSGPASSRGYLDSRGFHKGRSGKSGTRYARDPAA